MNKRFNFNEIKFYYYVIQKIFCTILFWFSEIGIVMKARTISKPYRALKLMAYDSNSSFSVSINVLLMYNALILFAILAPIAYVYIKKHIDSRIKQALEEIDKEVESD